jgi:hypothetical protein
MNTKYTTLNISGIDTKEISNTLMKALVNDGWKIDDTANAKNKDLLGEEFIITVYHRKAYA